MSYSWTPINAGDRMLDQAYASTTSGPFFEVYTRLKRLHDTMTYSASRNTSTPFTSVFTTWPFGAKRPRNAIGDFIQNAYGLLARMAKATSSDPLYYNNDTRRPGKKLKNSGYTNYTGPMSVPAYSASDARQPINWLPMWTAIKAALDAMQWVETPAWTLVPSLGYWKFADLLTIADYSRTPQGADQDAMDMINQNSSTDPVNWTPDFPGKDQDVGGHDPNGYRNLYVNYSAHAGIMRFELPLPTGQIFAWTSRDDRVKGKFEHIPDALADVKFANILFYANKTMRYELASNKGTPTVTGDWGDLRAFLRVVDTDPGLALTFPAYPRPSEEIIYDWITGGKTAATDYTLDATDLDKDITNDYNDVKTMWINEAVGYSPPETAPTPSQFAQEDGAAAQVNTVRLTKYDWSTSTIAKLWTRLEVKHD